MKLDKRILLRIANEVLSIALVLGIVLATYCLVLYVFNQQLDLTRTGRYSLSDVTLKLLTRLQKSDTEIAVTIFYKDSTDAQERIRRGRVYDLLLEYHRRSGKRISLPRILNPDRRPDEVKRLGVRFPGSVVLERVSQGEDSTSKTRQVLITSSMLWKIPFEGGRPGKEQFQGEDAVSSALQKIIDDKRRTLYFVQGHNEASPFDREPSGLSEWIARLQVQNLDIRTLQLLQAGTIPVHASLVAIIGARNIFLPKERELLLEYAKRGGNLLILVDFNTDPGLDPLFQYFGVEVGKDLVIDTRSYQGNLIAPLPLYGEHPIVADLRAANESVLLSTVRSIERALGDTRGISTAHLLLSSQQAWAEKNYLHAKKARFEEGSGDRRGPISMAIAATRSVETSPEPATKPSQAVIFGDSDFATNEFVLFGSNMDLLTNAVLWLLGAEESIGISPKNPDVQVMTMSFHQIWTIFVIVVLILPGIVLAFGVTRWWSRRSL